MSLLAKLDQLPPFVCRLLARKRVGRRWIGLSHRDIEELSGLPKSTVAELSFRETWEGVPVNVVESFSLACGVDHLAARDARYFLNNKDMTYTESGPRQQLLMYTKLLTLWAEFRARQK